MVDMIVCIILARKVARIAGEKGRSKAGWVALFVLLFFAGELAGLVAGVIAAIALAEPDPTLLIVLTAVVGAGFGSIIAFSIVKNLAPVEKEPPWDELDDQDYREKFDPRGPREAADDGSYRSKPDDVQPLSPDDPAYRPREVDR
jgi:hypothetical protein